jgi:WD40 repeat protein
MTRYIPTIAAAALALIFAAPAIRHWRERPPVPPPPPAPVRSAWVAPGGVDAGSGGDYLFGLALAPDGRKLVYPASNRGTVALQLQDLRTGDASTLRGTEGAAAPFWSLDGTRIGFFADGRIKAFSLANQQTSDLADAPAGRGAAWSANGDLVFAPAANAALLHRHADGSITPFTTLESGESGHS